MKLRVTSSRLMSDEARFLFWVGVARYFFPASTASRLVAP